MKIKVWLALALLVVCTSVVAQEPKKAMSAEEKAMMDAMMKAMMPGDAHKLLDNMVGTFDAKVTSWMMPGQPPMVSTGTSVNTLDPRRPLRRGEVHGPVHGQPFNGIGYTGYDNVKKSYSSTWMDNMSTGVMTSTGSTSDSGKTWKFTADHARPDDRQGHADRRERECRGQDHYTFAMWSPGPDGKMMKTMEIAYSRK